MKISLDNNNESTTPSQSSAPKPKGPEKVSGSNQVKSDGGLLVTIQNFFVGLFMSLKVNPSKKKRKKNSGLSAADMRKATEKRIKIKVVILVIIFILIWALEMFFSDVGDKPVLNFVSPYLF